MTEHEASERRLSREDLLKLTAAAGGAAFLGTRVGRAGAALADIGAESGSLRVLDWVGYGFDGGKGYTQAMLGAYLKKYPKNKPKFTVMANEADALAKLQQGVNWDVFRPYVGWVKYFAESGLVQPWDTKQISNFKNLNPTMVKAGQYKGRQYGIPADWGFDAILYRTDKVKPKAKSWSLLFDERYKKKIAWFDDGSAMFAITGLYLGAKNPWDQTDAELKRAQKFLISKKHLARMFWAYESDLWEAFGNGDVWIAYAWPNDWVQMKKKPKPGLPVVYMHPKEKPISWIGMLMLLKGSPRPQLAHAYVDSWSSATAGKWLEDNYGYGHANLKAKPSSSDLLRALRLGNPNAVGPPNAYIDRDIPRRDLYAKLWQGVKSA
jgi:spermidine/putrescine transport system substrate-binding protein